VTIPDREITDAETRYQYDTDGRIISREVYEDTATLTQLGPDEPGRGPAHHHGAATPALHAAAVGADDVEGRVDRVRGLQRAAERTLDPEAVDGEGLLHALGQGVRRGLADRLQPAVDTRQLRLGR